MYVGAGVSRKAAAGADIGGVEEREAVRGGDGRALEDYPKHYHQAATVSLYVD